MKCMNCGYENKAGAQYCIRCGHHMTGESKQASSSTASDESRRFIDAHLKLDDYYQSRSEHDLLLEQHAEARNRLTSMLVWSAVVTFIVGGLIFPAMHISTDVSSSMLPMIPVLVWGGLWNCQLPAWQISCISKPVCALSDSDASGHGRFRCRYSESHTSD